MASVLFRSNHRSTSASGGTTSCLLSRLPPSSRRSVYNLVMRPPAVIRLCNFLANHHSERSALRHSYSSSTRMPSSPSPSHSSSSSWLDGMRDPRDMDAALGAVGFVRTAGVLGAVASEAGLELKPGNVSCSRRADIRAATSASTALNAPRRTRSIVFDVDPPPQPLSTVLAPSDELDPAPTPALTPTPVPAAVPPLTHAAPALAPPPSTAAEEGHRRAD
mmetsp:Transcript_26479/g.66362  ORF Transcript_26479/g.66362 Transcript_26479/m.66362 type:complete len:220 (-) Transcript_26479:313-972(-)